MRSRGSAGTRFCNSASSLQMSRRQQVDAGGGDLPELDVHAAGLLEHAAQAHARRFHGALGPLRGRQERSEPLLATEPDELAVPAQHGDPSTDRPNRTGSDDETGALAEGQRTGSGEQVEDDGHRHRRWNADRDEVDGKSVGPPFPVVDSEGHEERRAPADRRRREALDPTTPSTQQSQRKNRGRHGEHGEPEEPQHTTIRSHPRTVVPRAHRD